MIRANASSTLVANPAAMSARAIVGRPRASSSAVHEHRDLGVDRELPSSRSRSTVLPEPLAAPVALRGDGRLERVVVGVHPETEDMQLAFPQAEVARHERVDLDARDQRHPVRAPRPQRRRRGSRRACRGRSARRRARRRRTPPAPGVGGQDAVGARRMRMEVDGRRPRRDHGTGGVERIMASPTARLLRSRHGRERTRSRSRPWHYDPSGSHDVHAVRIASVLASRRPALDPSSSVRCAPSAHGRSPRSGATPRRDADTGTRPTEPDQTSTSCWIRSTWRARPVAGIDVDLDGVEDDRPAAPPRSGSAGR